jgi:hypothetical protein
MNMKKAVPIAPYTVPAKIADALLSPFMKFAAGTFTEHPQRTHRWNNTTLSRDDVAHLDRDEQVHCEGISSATTRFIAGIPIFHIPLLGGWKDYIVLTTNNLRPWHIGWISEDVRGVSNIPHIGPVRTLLGPTSVSFFGVYIDGTQIPITEIGRGRIGDSGPYKKIPLC